MYRILIVHSNGDGKTSQVVEFPTVDSCERAAQRLDKWQNGYSPWQVMRLDYAKEEVKQTTESKEWYLPSWVHDPYRSAT